MNMEQIVNWMLPEKRANKVVQAAEFFRQVLAPVMLIGVAASLAFGVIIDPQVTMKSSNATTPSGLSGTPQAVTVSLTDPGPLDRVVAALPDLANFALIVVVYAYYMWAERAEARAWRDTRRLVQTIGCIGLVLLFLPLLSGVATRAYFDIEVVWYDFTFAPLLVTVTMLVLLMSSADNRTGMFRERERAERLDEKMKDVV